MLNYENILHTSVSHSINKNQNSQFKNKLSNSSDFDYFIGVFTLCLFPSTVNMSERNSNLVHRKYTTLRSNFLDIDSVE